MSYNFTIESGATVRFPVAGKYCDRDIVATAEEGIQAEILENVSVTLDLADGNQTFVAPEGYLVKSGVIEKPATLVPENIREGTVVAGVTGTLADNPAYEVLEDVSITLDFEGGNQVITTSEGTVVASAIIQKPATLIPENIAEGIEVAGIVGTFEGGGGGSAEGFATVTFMNGNEVYYTRPVYIGDNCPDPVTQGRIEAPTKESTAQYDYTYSGWAVSDGGIANPAVLQDITADKTVYAAYTATTREYTITYYDDDGTTVLHTEQVAYGTVPSYTPTHSSDPDHYMFDGWTPTPVPVTGDASYTAVWKEKKALKDYSWADLDAMSIDEMKANFVPGEFGPAVGGAYSVLLGFDNMDLADGSGKVKMVLGTPVRLYRYISGVKYPAWGADKDWATCTFRTDSWGGVDYVISTSYPEFGTYGKAVKVKYTAIDGTIKETTDVLFPPSLSQLGYTDAPNEGEKFELFTDKTLAEACEDIKSFFYLSNAYTRTLDASSGSVYAVKKGSAPSLIAPTTMDCPPFAIVCI